MIVFFIKEPWFSERNETGSVVFSPLAACFNGFAFYVDGDDIGGTANACS